MSHPTRTDRRHFLQQSLATGAAALLGGCDRLSENATVRQLLGSAEHLNRRLQRTITPTNAMAREYPESELSPIFKSNGTYQPADPEYLALASANFTDWRLSVGGLVERPAQLSLEGLRALPSRTQITRHDCVEGWSCIGKWKGARLAALLEQVGPLPAARYVMFYCFDALDESGDRYYESIDFADAFHPQTILAYEMNDRPLPIAHGAPLRLRVERQLGYKMAKYLRAIELVDSFERIGGGSGGYWEDRGYEWYARI
ncbi:MAG TPA: molybdopterin-dependent oxidoreductase [Gammaproteobacteria bacterium]|nr:molybdopterin-dependent oxidoreductase [Gammaproteobacteria bacterium]